MTDENKKPIGDGFVMDETGKDMKQDPRMPKIDFSTFIFSLNSSALVHLGIIGEPGSNCISKNLVLAKQTIDIIGMIEEKTKGNLTEDETQLMKNILHDLRMMYVKEKEKK
jgi:hypothetical protein